MEVQKMKEYVKACQAFLSTIYSHKDIYDVLIEEVETGDDENFIFITLGFVIKDKPTHPMEIVSKAMKPFENIPTWSPSDRSGLHWGLKVLTPSIRLMKSFSCLNCR